LRDDAAAIATTMAGVLRDRCEGWDGVDAADVLVEDHSGLGGGKAYKLTNRAAPDASPVMLHIVHEFFCPAAKEPIFFDRQKIAHERLARAGLSPRRIAEDPDREWFVEAWGGCTLDPGAPGDVGPEVARLIARVHAIDTDWYDEIRARTCKRYPALQGAAPGSYIWRFASYPQHHMEPIGPALQRQWVEAGPAPVSAAGSRVVTVHGDVHHGNLVRSDEGLKLVDMESVCVSSAIQDIAYSMPFFCRTDEQKDRFLESYLQECGLPAAAEDVFALRLDAERCRIATNWNEPGGLWDTVYARREVEDLGTAYRRVADVAERAAKDAELAAEFVTRGLAGCEAVRQVRCEEGRPLLSMLVTAHRDAPHPATRASFTINWDGTIQWSFERWRALVLGVDDCGEVVLTNCMNERERLRLRMDAGAAPITGRRAPSSSPIALRLAGRHHGSAVVPLGSPGEHLGNEWQFVGIGPVGSAVCVHVEPDGVLRLADKPSQAIECQNGRTTAGTRLVCWHNSCEAHQRFVPNNDATLSPIGHPEVIWGLRGSHVQLVQRHGPDAALVFEDEVVAAARAEGPPTLATGDPPACPAGHILELASHPGLALSVAPGDGHDDSRRLVLMPVAEAERFVVGADDLRLAGSGHVIALGTPMVA
jgi:hypothetical protein